jgi:hypothetical protein
MVMELAGIRGREDELTIQLRIVRQDLAQRNAQARELPALEERLSALRDATPYRTSDVAQLETKLAELRAARSERASLRIEEAELLRAIESLRVALEQNGIRRVTLPMLENVNIAAPCPASWAEMDGDTDVRFCKSCEKNVYNLSMMSREEAESVLGAAGGKDICVRLYRRDDGTVLTQDCPVGLQKRHRFWRRAKGIAAAGLLASAFGLAYRDYVFRQALANHHSSSGAVSALGPG